MGWLDTWAFVAVLLMSIAMIIVASLIVVAFIAGMVFAIKNLIEDIKEKKNKGEK